MAATQQPISAPKLRAPNPAVRARQQYQRAQIETASPARLVVLLYEGAIRFCTLGEDAMRQENREAQNRHLVRAQRIVGELMSSLNTESGGAMAENLNRVYLYMLEELVQANLYDRPEPIHGVLGLLRDLREAWLEAERTMQTQAGAA